MESSERAIKLRRDELVEIKKLYETVMTFTSHGMFYRSGRIVGNRLVKPQAPTYHGSGTPW